MKALTSRSTATVIAVVVVILATLFGVHRSVGAGTKKIEAQFYDGVYLEDAGYAQASIGDQLSQRANAAMGLISIAESYPAASAEAEELKAARYRLLDEVDSITGQYEANRALQSAYEALWEKLIGEELTERDRNGASGYASTMDNAQSLINSSSYNSAVSEYINITLKAFPVNILKALAFCDYPEYFGVEG